MEKNPRKRVLPLYKLRYVSIRIVNTDTKEKIESSNDEVERAIVYLLLLRRTQNADDVSLRPGQSLGFAMPAGRK